MGLDMYLYRNHYIKNWDHMVDEERFDFILKRNDVEIPFIGKPSILKEEVMYWRKANAIHKWFVDNVQGGEDDCREYEVSREQLESLLNVCQQVNDNHWLAEKLLPTQPGCFFGTYDYDKWYFDDLIETISSLRSILSFDEEYKKDGMLAWFSYQSSW